MKSSFARGLRTAELLTLTAALVLAGWVARDGGAAQQQRASQSARESAEPGAEPHLKLRENTVLEATGTFKITGERAIFTTDDGVRLSALENLNLERVAIATSESPDPLVWSVTGTITEFRGANFLLITRAMLQPKTGDSLKTSGSAASKSRSGKPAAKP